MNDGDGAQTISGWKQYYGRLAETNGKFRMEFDRTTYTHSWRNSLRIINERCGIGNGANVLDAGCGWGRMLLGVLAERKDLTVYAMDLELDALELGRRLLEGQMDNRIDWVEGDVRHIDQPNAVFDAAYSARVFQHVDPPQEGVAEIVRVLKPGGRFVIFLQNRLCPLNVNYYAPLYTPTEVRAWFSGLKLTTLNVSSMDFYPNIASKVLPARIGMAMERIAENTPIINQFGGKVVAWGIK